MGITWRGTKYMSHGEENLFLITKSSCCGSKMISFQVLAQWRTHLIARGECACLLHKYLPGTMGKGKSNLYLQMRLASRVPECTLLYSLPRILRYLCLPRASLTGLGSCIPGFRTQTVSTPLDTCTQSYMTLSDHMALCTCTPS
jgi:hypothetical protein